ncbi:MAG: restriction endonuclease [Prevotella sp.]|nr:restriction endonuclease [Prevotella sp.]
MIPQFEEFLYPFLLALKDSNLTTKQMRAKMIDNFNLTADDCATTTKGGNSNQLSDRIGWCRQYFRRALFIEIPQRGTYAITQRGLDYLSNHTSLHRSDLMQYPEFAAYASSNGIDVTPDISSPESDKDLTPTESLEKAYNAINNDLAEELLSTILEQTPSFFEKLVLKLLEKMGYGKGVVTQRTSDEGIDGIINEDKLGLDIIHIQAKRYKPDNKVGRPLMQAFVGALDGAGVNKGVFITTSNFTKEALDYKSSKKIAKIDGKQLTNLMIQYNVGVTTEYTYEVKRIDKDFFEE